MEVRHLAVIIHLPCENAGYSSDDDGNRHYNCPNYMFLHLLDGLRSSSSPGLVT